MSSEPAAKPAGLPPPQNGQPCPCGSGKPFEQCCGPRLSGVQPAANAEELLRSRFTAHVAHDWPYLHRTYGPTANKPYVADAEAATPPAWSRLVIHAHEPGAHPDIATVDFTAYFADQNGEHAMPEKSEFVRKEGRWLFTRSLREGPAPVHAAPKVGRNDPCPCGSGRKYKHCCGK